jgi:hypothetical protein
MYIIHVIDKEGMLVLERRYDKLKQLKRDYPGAHYVGRGVFESVQCY